MPYLQRLHDIKVEAISIILDRCADDYGDIEVIRTQIDDVAAEYDVEPADLYEDAAVELKMEDDANDVLPYTYAELEAALAA